MRFKHPTSSHSAQSSALSALAVKLNTWRSQRTSRRTPIPEPLRQQAVELLAHYPRTQIITTLGINSAMLKAWEGSVSATQPQFVSIDLADSAQPSEQPPLELTLANNRGQQITLQGAFSHSQMALVMRVLNRAAEETYL